MYESFSLSDANLQLPNRCPVNGIGLGPDGAIICGELTNYCGSVEWFPQTNTILISESNIASLNQSILKIAPNISKQLNIPLQEATTRVEDFFESKIVMVEPKGAQGFFYGVGRYLQTGPPAVYAHKAISLSVTAGKTGLATVSNNPVIGLCILTSGGIFFNGLGMVVGNNIYGRDCKTVSFVCNIPMKGVEFTINNFIFAPITMVTGIPLFLNATKEMEKGLGLTQEDVKALAEKAKKNYGKRMINGMAKFCGFGQVIPD